MPDVASNLSDNKQNTVLTPPSGDPVQAEKYVNQLIQLVDEHKLLVSHTDLAKFDPSSLQDHFGLDLKEYKVEVSHSKYPITGKDSFVILFTNIKQVSEGQNEKIILAYMHLDETQFKSLKKSFNEQIETIRKAEEKKRLEEAMLPIDELLEGLNPVKNSEVKNYNINGKDHMNHNSQNNNTSISSASIFN